MYVCIIYYVCILTNFTCTVLFYNNYISNTATSITSIVAAAAAITTNNKTTIITRQIKKRYGKNTDISVTSANSENSTNMNRPIK